MQYVGTKFKVFNPTTRKWEIYTDYAEADRAERAYLMAQMPGPPRLILDPCKRPYTMGAGRLWKRDR